MFVKVRTFRTFLQALICADSAFLVAGRAR